MSTIDRALISLAEAFGLEPEYTDIWGITHRADLQTTKLILAAKGVKTPQGISQSGTGVLVVAEDNLPPTVDLPVTASGEEEKIPADTAAELSVRVIDEQGIEESYSFDSDRFSLESDELSGGQTIRAPFPSGLRPGSYRVNARALWENRVANAAATWIICPPKAYLPPEMHEGRKIGGVGAALYGIRSAGNWGVGDFSDLKVFIDWAKDALGVDMVGLNPLHALFNRDPFNTSPYMPSSRIFRNFIYLDVRAIPDFSDSADARSLVDRPETLGQIRKLRESERVDYEHAAELKLNVLSKVFATFMSLHGVPGKEDRRWDAFQRYIRSQGSYLESYVTFCALRDYFLEAVPPAPTWRDWPREFQDPRSDEVKRFRAKNEAAVLFHKFMQWQIDEQLRSVQKHALNKGMLIGLYHDEALSVDRNGADFWALREFFHEGFSVGAPPDPFAPDGQDWGFAPPHRDMVRNSGYEPFLKNLQANCTHGGALRIDHVMQLHRLFWIPAGKKPEHGVYVKDYEEDLLNLLALESVRNKTVIIGEDLGTVPFHFRETLMGRAILSYRLFYFERDRWGNQLSAREYPADALVSISTHDLPTLAGFWLGRDIEVRREIGQLDEKREAQFREDRTRHKAKIIEKLVQDGALPSERAHAAWESPFPTDHLHSAVLRFLFSTPSRMVLINQEDVFLDVRQQNLPGTTWEHANWVTKMKFTLEELRTDPEAVRLTRKFKSLLKDCNRCAG